MATMDLRRYIRDIPNFPKPGIIFKDITTLLKDQRAFRACMDRMVKVLAHQKVDYVVSVESRGFIFGAVLAYQLKAGFIPVRKKGKLPGRTKRVSYKLEYGSDTLEIHADALTPGARVLIVDDLLATGGTVAAVAKLVKTFRVKVIGIAFVIELTFLKGRAKLKSYPIHSLIQY